MVQIKRIDATWFFHLNHVGYKDELDMWVNKSMNAHFHLNHVGYKVLLDDLTSSDRKAFI